MSTDSTTNAGATVTAPPPLDSFHHVGLTVCDVEASEAWYQRVLGFERVMVEPHPGASGYAVVMNRPGTVLFIGLDNHDANERERFAEHRTGLDHVAIHVGQRHDLDRWAEHFDGLSVARGDITEADEPFPHAILVFRDPDNIQLELFWS